MLDDLLPIAERPLTLFEPIQHRSPELMSALDAVNDRFGKKSLVIAREGFKNRSGMRQKYRSPRYTTRISDVPVIRKQSCKNQLKAERTYPNFKPFKTRSKEGLELVL